MTCSVEARADIHDAIEALADHEKVIDAKRVSSANRTGLEKFGIEVVVIGTAVPSEITRELVLHDLELRPDLSAVQGDRWSEVVATA
jgi:hypothetical protein